MSVTMLIFILSMSTNALLAVHLGHLTNENGHCDGDCESKTSGNQLPEHDPDKCHVCKSALGISGKFVYDCSVSITLTNDHAILTAPAVSEYINQYQFSSAVPRGPPLS